jgi:hypothetical protein
MRRLIIAGLLYLTGVAIILIAKPSIMFREDGRWKEFGIGRDPEHFTYIPFWLFTIVWALLSYVIVLFIEDPLSLHSDENEAPVNRRGTKNSRNSKINSVKELTPGYYMLNETSSGRDGVPRYVYLGPSAPEE